MARFEYQVTTHAADEFKRLVYVCAEGSGQCRADEVSGEELKMLASLLNERGLEGWELTQVQFATDSIIVFWKRVLEQ